MEPISQVAVKGIERAFDYGIAITVLILALIASGSLAVYLMKRCDARFTESLSSLKELNNNHAALTEKVSSVVQSNTVAVAQFIEVMRIKN